MEKTESNSINWNVGDKLSTSDPSISAMSDEVPTLTVATILGVAVVIIVAIIFVFVLGVLIDWRQQRLIDKKMVDVKRMKSRRINTYPEADDVSIANNMAEDGVSTPPAEALRQIP
ncbi:uncharacterized protein LOC116767746 [Danaus plexippus]|uniref:Uncharacterized protein n=1 Tax=Danaus plexippus plexippus TaxID=278856 RepID=A0A212FGW7_DANPL|nr:uncharacterized protein LOC116767746 [Danaus plexippus]OWR52953.1 hypothetical protein KGM_205073 [Danaus plexippus plexippus]